ncbi:hypothetical protein E3P92_03510 [Wallemia ichthyophaga]|nr:hypothetical protein E3P94_03454 [Wallemia ichthyophaga]TIB09367.1 hypothetical protein E3P92_03510 [Wallemia ichthyophaga]TIB20026.1 hypothetical protein E3P89_03475 [Wallemia ichthyophaga]
MNKLGGIAGILIFISSLISYAAETELAQVVESRLGYSKPYFMLYLAHSSFCFCLPLHLLFLKITSSVPSKLYLKGLALATRNVLTPNASQPSHNAGFWDILPVKVSLIRMYFLTAMATLAAVCWWVSVKYTTSAFWAYIFAIYLLGEKLQKSKLGAVVLACSGVVLIAYGGERSSRKTPLEEGEKRARFSTALLGDLLVFIGSLTFALFEVCLKKYASLPDKHDNDERDEYESDAFDFGESSDEEDVEHQKKHRDDGDEYEHEQFNYETNNQDEIDDTLKTSQRPGFLNHANSTSPLIEANNVSSGNLHRMSMSRRESSNSISTLATNPPFGLHPNLVSTSIGLITVLTLWIPIPILHWIGWEKFELPPSAAAYGYIAAMVMFGMVFNGAFIVSLRSIEPCLVLMDHAQALCFIWGPVMASVGR